MIDREWQPIETAPRDGTEVEAAPPATKVAEFIQFEGNVWMKGPFYTDCAVLEEPTEIPMSDDLLPKIRAEMERITGEIHAEAREAVKGTDSPTLDERVVEIMARAIAKKRLEEAFDPGRPTQANIDANWIICAFEVRAALTALESAGYVVSRG